MVGLAGVADVGARPLIQNGTQRREICVVIREAGDQQVVPLIPDQPVGSATANQHVGLLAADEIVISIATDQHIRAVAPIQPIVVGFAEQEGSRADAARQFDVVVAPFAVGDDFIEARKGKDSVALAIDQHLDGVLTINAPGAQGASGNLESAGEITLADVTLSIPLDIAHAIVVSLDGQPLASSKRMLLQVMTEEKPTNFRTESLGDRRHRITSIGENPWVVRNLAGVVRLKRSDASKLKVTALDQFGQPTSNTSSGDTIRLRADTLLLD